MKIIKSDTLPENTDRVILVREDNALAPWVTDAGQRAYLEGRFGRGKNSGRLNHLDHHVFAVRLEEEGKSPAALLEKARLAGHRLYRELAGLDPGGISVINGGISAEETIAFAEGIALSAYRFTKYKTGEEAPDPGLEEIRITDEKLSGDHVEKLQNLVLSVYQARDLVNEPLSFLTAEQLAEEVIRMGKTAGFGVEVFRKKQIESLKMGGLLAVNRGSVDPPTFSILSYHPENAVNNQPIVLVGKGIVYDTGGMSLKPTRDSMDYMKSDMGGAAAVAGAFYAAASNRLPVWIIGLIPATDNRPDGNAYVPGDVVTMHDGTTVEVLNTDAEGRMILADALSYARQYDPELVIELSTLTGSAQMAIDKYGIVGMGNASREMMNLLKESGEHCGERIAEFPFWEEYREQLKSEIADLKNIGGKYAGAITAGKFLEHFTRYPFVHLDIAGAAYNKTPYNYRGNGGSGVGVRILYHFLLDRSN